MADVKVFWNVCFLVFVTGPVFTAVVEERENFCSAGEVPCDNGSCVSTDRLCDGIADCADRSDERACGTSSDITLSLWSPDQHRLKKRAANKCRTEEVACDDGTCLSRLSLCNGSADCPDRSDEMDCAVSDPLLSRLSPERFRSKRQAAGKCRKNQWQCRDKSCISFDGKCDGIVDCPDGSDESHPLCRLEKCQNNWFRCTYGACVDGTAPCNGIQECADNSDELLPRCRNETDEIQGQFKCQDRSMIPAANHCDGVVDCPDGSDETVRACAAMNCPSYLFQCAYGACVDQGANCDGKRDCADNSDESDELCNRISAVTTTTKRPQTGNCILPQYPANGGYVVQGAPYAKPGDAFQSIFLNVSCNPGYGVDGANVVYCYDGFWSTETLKCVRYCKLSPHPSVEYRCLLRGTTGVEGNRPCREFEPTGTVVRPECKSPNYYSSEILRFMQCIEGSWDYIAICSPECGRITPEGEFLIMGGRNAKRGELPWHAGIYTKDTTPYMQRCGGSLISTNVVISAAHCFWDDVKKKLPPSNYAVAVGKLYRPWNNPQDADAQKSDVSDIRIPPRFQGLATNFQDDIALVILTTTIEYKTYVRPVCLDFNINFDRRQLQEGNIGKVAGWGLTAENGQASQVLKVVDLPYVKIETCYAQSPPGFREYITSDKICAGYGNGTALCKGDSGGGLAFPESDRGTQRFYLRGIVSTAQRSHDKLCNAYTFTTFTQMSKHEHFIKESLL